MMRNVFVHCLFISVATSAVEPLRFIGLGDWGDDDGNQEGVATAMGNWAADRSQDFILSLGDNFYPAGVTNIDDPQWDTKWRQMYMNKESLQIPWHVMVGNHDHGGNITAQIEFSKTEPMWQFPSLYYKFTVMAGDTSVEFIVYDTELIERDTEQQEWLFEAVASSTADWLIVTAHAPIYSSGRHGIRWEVWWVEAYLSPLLEEYNVGFYISGHDHDLQHIIKNGTNVDYIITGGGHEIRYPNPIAVHQMEKKGASLVWRASSLGFAEFEIEGDAATVQYINENGEILYSFTKANPRKVVTN